MPLPLILYLDVLTARNAFKLKCLEGFMEQIYLGLSPGLRTRVVMVYHLQHFLQICHP